MGDVTHVELLGLSFDFDAASPSTFVTFALLNLLVHSILPIPVSSVMWITAVVLYGPIQGFFFALITSVLGCSLALPVARSCLRPTIIRLLGEHQSVWHSLDRAIVRERWKIPLLMRATPVSPVVATNFFLALTSIDEWTYVWTVFVGMIPAGVPYAYAAVVGEQVLKEFPPRDPLMLGLALVGLAATIVAVYKVGVIATEELNRHGVESPRESPSGAPPKARKAWPDGDYAEAPTSARGGAALL